LENEPIDLVLQDMNFEQDTTSGLEGLDLLKKIKEINAHLPVILFSAWAHIDVIVEGMKLGADNFFVKPWDNSKLLQLIADTLDLTREKQKKLSRKELDAKYNFSSIIGESDNFLSELETAGLVAKTDTNILLRGENGTGKDELAKAIHQNSKRADAPFVKVNSAGISTNLFDSELFGHVKGAFTDARQDRQGRFAEAHGGTLFLDEIGDLALDSQVKLLRVIQDGQFEPLGSNKTIKVDVRIIAATNVNLEVAIAEGRFREDLYYRLNTIELTLPALRDRGADKLALANHFISLANAKYKKNATLSKESVAYINRHEWAGNIRELAHALERAVLTEKNGVANISEKGQSPASQYENEADSTLDAMEKRMIEKALRDTDFNLTQAAKKLGINRTSLYRRLEKYEITVP
jgi:DNA-binding NtrC family response regulator